MNHFRKLAALAIASVLVLTGCSMAYENSTTEPLVTGDVSDSEAVIETLRWAEKIELKKHLISAGDVYDVKADGVAVGQIRGQFIYALGDTYSLFSEAGNLVGSEGESFRLVTHEAKLFDYENNPSGSIKESFSWPLTVWDFYDEQDTHIASANQNLNITLDFTVTDLAGIEQYRINKNIFAFTGAEITITRLANEPVVSGLDVLWLGAIANEVAEAQESKGSN